MKIKKYTHRKFPVENARQILEPGPIVLVSSFYKGQRNIMTMGWHMIMEFSPSLFGCIIAESNHSFDLIRKSKQCIINVPSIELADIMVGIGNCSGDDTDKFQKFGLTPAKATKIQVPMIKECFASFECRLADARLIKKYNFFIFEIVAAHVAPLKYPKTLHYHGKGVFSSRGDIIDMKKKFTNRDMLKR